MEGGATCRECGKSFATRQGLGSHSRVHLKDKQQKMNPSRSSSRRVSRARSESLSPPPASPQEEPASPVSSYCSSSSHESLIGLQPGDSGYDTLDESSGGTFGTNETSSEYSSFSSSLSSEDDNNAEENEEPENGYSIPPPETNHHYPKIKGWCPSFACQ